MAVADANAFATALRAVLLGYILVVVLCAVFADLLFGFVLARAIDSGELRARPAVPGLHWLSASIGAFIPLAVPTVFGLLSPAGVTWVIGSVTLACAVGAAVDLPFSAVRNWRAGESSWRVVPEVLALAVVAVLLGVVSLTAFLLPFRIGGTWGAPA